MDNVEMSTIGWIAVAVVALLALVAVAVWLAGRSGGRRRDKAEELRREAARHETELMRSDAEARETRARADLARAEAERKEAEARRLAEEARHKQSTVTEHRREYDERITRADELDPDGRTDTRSMTMPGQSTGEHDRPAPSHHDGTRRTD